MNQAQSKTTRMNSNLELPTSTVEFSQSNLSINSQDLTPQELETYRLHRRFDRMGRLVGDDAMKRLMSAHVMIIGLGGVGSWAAESIVRSGVGKVTIVDFDEICITNFNRQLHALQGLVGEKKAEVLADRLQKINPQAKIQPLVRFYTRDFAQEIIGVGTSDQPDFVIDAIDSITSKCHLLSFCKSNGIPVVSSTGSGGRLDPTAIRISDLADTQLDPLARDVRRILREKYDFPKTGPFGISAIYSPEPVTAPHELTYDNGKGFRCVCPQGADGPFTCDNRNLIMGNASFVTGAFGLAAASVAIRALIDSQQSVTNHS